MPPHRTWLLPALLGAALYLVNLPGTWIYDDLYFAKEDPRLHDVHRWREYLTQGYFDGGADNLWRPLTSLTYAVQTRLHGDTAWPYHLLNLLLHAIACALAAKLALRLSGSDAVGLITGLLFAAHPIHVDAVSSIVGRAEEMSAIGVLAALLLVIGREMTIRRALAVTGCFLFAALSKEQGVLLPFMLLAWGLINREKKARTPGVQWLIILLTCTLAAYISYRNFVAPWFWDKSFLDWTINPIVRSGGRDRWLMPIAILGRYTSLLIVPWKLSPDYSAMVFTTIQRLPDPFLWIGIGALAAYIAGIVIAWRRRNRATLFCFIGLGLTYFLASNIIIIGTIFGERLMYLPSAFACILVAMALARMKRLPRAIVVAVFLLAFIVRTETYAFRWNDRLGFYRYALETQPQSVQIALLLGDELETRVGDLDGAERIYAKGRETCPGSWRIWLLSSRLAERRGKLDDALQFAHEGMKQRPSLEMADAISRIAEKMHEQKK